MDILLAVGSIAVSDGAIHRTNVRSRSCRAGRSPQGGVVAAGLVAKYVVDARETSHPSAVLGWVILSAAFVPWALLPVDVYTCARPAWLPSPLAVTRALGDAAPSPTRPPTWGLCRTCAAPRTSVRTHAQPHAIHCTPDWRAAPDRPLPPHRATTHVSVPRGAGARRLRRRARLLLLLRGREPRHPAVPAGAWRGRASGPRARRAARAPGP